MTETVWTEERETKLRTLWPLHEISAAQIAKRLGGSITRSAVIGKAYRLGLPRRKTGSTPRPIWRRSDHTKAAQRRPLMAIKGPAVSPITRALVSLAPLPLPAEDEAPIGLKTIHELESHDCRWFYGDPRQVTRGFCGCKTIPGTSWCAKHMISRPGSPGVYTLPTPERIARVAAAKETVDA